jgi:large repetitive protein
MNMEPNVTRNFFRKLKLNYLGLAFLKLSVIVILSILTEGVQAQGCSIILKIKDPSPVCSPSTVDLTPDAVTSGSTNGLIFYYYSDPDLTMSIPSPTKVGAGTYYIKGVLTGSCKGFAVASVKATVLAKPNVVIPNPVIKRAGGNVDLTLPQITAGSDAGLSFSYWYDTELTRPFLSPQSATNGVYFIKGTSNNGCSDTQSITVND